MLLGVVDLTTVKKEKFLTGPDIDDAFCLTKYIKQNVINNPDDDKKKEIKSSSSNSFLILIITLFIEKKEVVIAVVGNFTDEQKAIYKKFSNKNINLSNLSLKTLLTPNLDNLSSTNILYITKYYHGNIDSMLNNIDTYNKLIIVDRKYFKAKKAMIKFYTYRDKLKFLINNKLALESGIMLNASLMPNY
jgi:hypothetical protein